MTKTQKINRRVKIKSTVQLFAGCVGTAIIVSENLTFCVNLDEMDGMSGEVWFDYNELEFLDGK